MKRNLLPYSKDILDNLELAEGFTVDMSSPWGQAKIAPALTET
jgi:hypothetical protein